MKEDWKYASLANGLQYAVLHIFIRISPQPFVTNLDMLQIVVSNIINNVTNVNIYAMLCCSMLYELPMLTLSKRVLNVILTSLIINYLIIHNYAKLTFHFLVTTVIKDGRYGVGNTEPFLSNTYCSRLYNSKRYCNTWQFSQCSNKCLYNHIGIKCYGKNYILYPNVFKTVIKYYIQF